MLIKKLFIALFKKSSDYQTIDIYACLEHALKKINRLDLLKSDFKYKIYFMKVAYSVFLKRNAFFLSKDDKYDIVIDAALGTFSPEIIQKFLSKTKDGTGLEKYLAQVFENKIMSDITTRQRQNEKVMEVDEDYFNNIPQQDNFIHTIEFSGMIEDIKKYLQTQKRYKDNLVQFFEYLLDGFRAKEISHKMGISPVYSQKIFQTVTDAIYDYAKETHNTQLVTQIDKYRKRKFSSIDEYMDAFIAIFVGEEKAAKRVIARTIAIRKQTNILDENVLRDKTLNPNYTSDSIKAEVDSFLAEYDDDTEILEEDGIFYSLKSLN